MTEELDEGVWESMQRLLQRLVPERSFRYVVKHPPNSICIRRDNTSFMVKAINDQQVSVSLYADAPGVRSYTKVLTTEECLRIYQDPRLYFYTQHGKSPKTPKYQ